MHFLRLGKGVKIPAKNKIRFLQTGIQLFLDGFQRVRSMFFL